MRDDTGLSDGERGQQGGEANVVLEKDIGPPKKGENFPQRRTSSNAVAKPLEIFPCCFGDQLNFVTGGDKLIGQNRRDGLNSTHARSKGVGGEKNLHWNECPQDR